MKDRVDMKITGLEAEMRRQIATATGSTDEIRNLVGMIETLIVHVAALEITVEDLITANNRAEGGYPVVIDRTAN